MQYIVRALANLRHYLPGGNETLVVEGDEEATVASLLESLHIPVSEVMAVHINNGVVTADYRLSEGDVVELLPVLAGG